MLQSMKITLAITAKTKVLVKWRYKDNLTRFLRNLKVLVVWTKAEKTHQQMELKIKLEIKILKSEEFRSIPVNHSQGYTSKYGTT